MHVEPKDEYVPYLDRSVPRRGFRTYIFGTEGKTKLVESYDEFDIFIHSDEWFATKEEAEAPKKSRKKTEG